MLVGYNNNSSRNNKVHPHLKKYKKAKIQNKETISTSRLDLLLPSTNQSQI